MQFTIVSVVTLLIVDELTEGERERTGRNYYHELAEAEKDGGWKQIV